MGKINERIWKSMGDIDKTKEGAPYVVSDDGWGWLGLAILALVPVVFMGFALQGMANFISSHPIWIIVGYILLTLGIGAISYKRKTGLWNVLGMVATSISFLPILLTEMLVEIPSIVRAGDSVGGMIELLIEWIFITLMVVGIAVFVHAVNMLTISPVRHLIMGLVYCVVTGLILAKQLNVERIIELKTVYGIIS